MIKEELQKKYISVCSNFNETEIGLLHLRSVENFIVYIDKLESVYEYEVSEKLSEYLDLLVKNKPLFNSEKIDSLFLFSEYINPIGVIYQKQLDFGLEVKLWMNIVTGLILIITCLIINSYLLNVALLLLLFWYSRRQYFRRKKNKFYKYQY